MVAYKTVIAAKSRCKTFAASLLSKAEETGESLLKEADKARDGKDYKKALSLYSRVGSGFAPFRELAKTARQKGFQLRKSPEYKASLKPGAVINKPDDDKKEILLIPLLEQ